MLAKDPAARPTAAQVREELHAVLASPAPGASSRRRWWLVPAVLAAVALLGTGGWYGLTVLGQEDPGRFAVAPAPCELLTDAQAAQLLKGTARRAATREGECRWQVHKGSRSVRSITVRTWAEQPTGDFGGPEVAALRFANERTVRGGTEGVAFRKSVGPVSDVRDVGEAAIVQSTFERSLGAPDEGRADSTVLLRTSNLLAEVVWHEEDAKRSSKVDQKPVLATARMVSTALRE